MAKNAVDYFQWLSENGNEIDEVGIQSLITDKLEQAGKEWGVFMAKKMMESLAKYLFEMGRKPLETCISLERDATLRSNELSLVVDTQFEGTPEQYMLMSFMAWRSEQIERERLERLNLWGHIKQWLNYKFSG